MYLEAQGILLGGLLALMVVIHSTDAICMSCPQGWIYHNQSCYIKFLDEEFKMSWLDAYKTCTSLDAQLLVLNSKQETDFVSRMVTEYFPETHYPKRIWLGCKEIDGRRECSDDNQQQLAILDKEQTCIVLSPFTSDFAEKRCLETMRVTCEKQMNYKKGHTRCQAVIKQDAGLVTPHCLLGHAYTVIPIKHPIQCCKACYKDPNCHSFNLSGKMCHLNNVTISQVDADKFVTTVDSCAHYRLDQH